MLTDPVALQGQLAQIGRDPERGGYSRHLFTAAELELRAWFGDVARDLGLVVETDDAANLWATWAPDAADASAPGIATGSHLDSVPGGGAFDGPLGIVSAFAAIATLRSEGHTPSSPVHVIAFAEEEGARFGFACLGSRLLTGTAPTEVMLRRDSAGLSIAEAFRANGLDPDAAGRDRARLRSLAAYVELHVEQGRQLAPLGAPVGIATTILAHGRWRIAITGRGDHAGATELASRRDPVLVASALVLAARTRAVRADPAQRARATVGRMEITPGGTNAIASRVEIWLDARAGLDDDVRALVDRIVEDAEAAAASEGCELGVVEESFSSRVVFDEELSARLDRILGGVPHIPTGAGHDAGILAPFVPSAMLFVRNPDGVSHSPHESATDSDIRAGAAALTAVLRELT